MGISQSLFPIKIYRDFYPNVEYLKNSFFPKLESVFLETEKNNALFMQGGTLCSYDSNWHLHIDFPEETREVVEFVENSAKEFWKEYNYHPSLTPYVIQMWANTTPKGGWVQSHLHGSMPFTAVLYVDASPEQGNLFLENPLELVLMTQPVGPDTKYPMGEEIEVNSGDLIIFPAYLRHSVKVNTTDCPRLMLAFNLGCKGEYFNGHWTTG